MSILIAQILTTVTGEGEGKDVSDKRLEAGDHRYSCLILMKCLSQFYGTMQKFWILRNENFYFALRNSPLLFM